MERKRGKFGLKHHIHQVNNVISMIGRCINGVWEVEKGAWRVKGAKGKAKLWYAEETDHLHLRALDSWSSKGYEDIDFLKDLFKVAKGPLQGR